MEDWRQALRVDPVPLLASSANRAVACFARRDLLGQNGESVETLWHLPRAEKLLRRQQDNGSWKYPGAGGGVRSEEDYSQLETYRSLGILVEMLGFTSEHPAIRKAADYLFTCQTPEGDIRGIYGTQYSPNYTAGMMELLIKAGYEDDPRIEKAFHWLLSVRQDDGGWAIPIRTTGMTYNEAVKQPEPVQPDRAKPFSHLVTGVVLRALAAHSRHRTSQAAGKAADLLASRLFQRDKYPDRGDVTFWEKVSFPFWFTDIVSSLDSLSLMGFSRDDARISHALDWLRNRQRDDGTFQLKLLRNSDKDLDWWVCLAICRVFRRVYGFP
ncbi:MAG: terpene cyclase/mutase family protein [Chloroflexi bacterium]|nr:terpene cyclase/mutase family protein [Chloroflexota bacterium]